MNKFILSIGLALGLISPITYAEDLDLLVIYSDEVESNLGGRQATLARIDTLVDYANVAFENSKINIQLKLVHSEKIPVPEDTEITDNALEAIRANTNINIARQARKPDLTVYLATGDGDFCGKAYEPADPPDRLYGISLVRWDCLTTLAHEIGHNLGAGHGETENGFNPGFPIATAVGYGEENMFGTVMSLYGYYQADRIQYFSNPRISACTGGLKCGTTNADSAAGINKNLSFVKLYSDQWDSRSGTKVAEFGDPTYGNSQYNCNFVTTFSTGGTGYIYTEYKATCDTGVFSMGVEENFNPNTGRASSTCKFHPKSEGIYGDGSCTNWRIYALTN